MNVMELELYGLWTEASTKVAFGKVYVQDMAVLSVMTGNDM